MGTHLFGSPCRLKLCSEGENLFVFSENVSLALYAQALDFVKSLLYPRKSRAKPDALYVDPLILNAVSQFVILFAFLIWIAPAASQWYHLRHFELPSGKFRCRNQTNILFLS